MACLALGWFLPALSLSAQLLPDDASIDATALDSSGFIYLAGTIATADLPVTPGVLQPTPPATCSSSACAYGYLAKVAPSGDAVVWATYLFPAASGAVTRMAVGKDGNLYVARSASTNTVLPALGGYQSTPANIFVAEVSSDGKTLLAETYFGGDGDTIAALQVDAAGSVYLAGTARSTGFPTTPGAYQRQPAASSQGTCASSADQFVAKFDGTLKTLVFSTLIGGSSSGTTDAFAIGPDGSLYLTGTRGTVRGPCWDRVFTRLAADASAAIYSNSGLQLSGGYTIAVDADGSAYVGGDNRVYTGPAAGAVLKFNPQGVQVASQEIGGYISSLAISGSELTLTGSASTETLATTSGSPPACVLAERYSSIPYVARLSLPSLQIAYAGYLPARNLWLVGPEKVLASYPYSGAVPLAVLAPGPPQAGTVTCLANAATYSGYNSSYHGFAMAPGEILSLFGSQIGPSTAATAEFDATGAIASQLAGTQVLIDGQPAPLLYAALNQINLVAPFALTAGKTVTFELRRNGAVAASFLVNVVLQHEGLFTLDSTGTGQLAALNQDGSVNSSANPAAAGTAVVLFATGLGAMTPLPVDGSRPSQAVNRPVASYHAVVSGSAATIEYIGNAPTLVEGVVQINIRLPNPLPSASAAGVASVSIAIDDGGGTSGTIAVQ
jgi:uncharacterized protein (TIGR03437 family)